MDQNRTETAREVPLIIVAALTCDRPTMLEVLLAAFSELQKPQWARVEFMIIDNHPSRSAQEIVEKYQIQIPDLVYVSEERRGIPVARNRALCEALSRGARALCFIDDDEYPCADWLRNLADHWNETGSHLLGGPVLIAPAREHLGHWKKLIHTSLSRRQVRKNRQTQSRARRGGKFTIVTNNWLCDMTWLGARNLMFDEKFEVSGGSDVAFFREAAAADAKLAWCPDAIVFEMIGDKRLSLRYQFDRARCQSINHFRMRHSSIDPSLLIVTILIALLRTMTGLFLILFPVLGFASLTIGVRSVGWAFGRVQALLGKHSRLYG